MRGCSEVLHNATTATYYEQVLTFTEAVEWWHESLESTASDNTLRIYRDATNELLSWMNEVGHDTSTIPDRRTLDAFFTWLRKRPNKRNGKPLAPSYVQQRWRSLQQLYRFFEVEDMVSPNPFTPGRMEKPSIPDEPVPIFSDDDIARLMKSTDGKDPADRRDRAIVRVLLDCGVRIGELCGIELDHVDFAQKLILVTGKGSNSRTVPYNVKSGTELRRWLMVRPRVQDPHLFLNLRGRGTALTTSGVRQMLERRADAVGVHNPHPHRFRHTAAHLWILNGGAEVDLQRIMGWNSNQMVAKYGRSAGAERAQLTARRLASADRY